MSTNTMTSLLQFAEIWIPESDDIWVCKEATYSDDGWKPEAARLAVSAGSLIDQCIQRRGPLVVADVALGKRSAGTSPMLVALPTYDREEVSSILFFAFHATEDFHAAVEVWSGSMGDFELHHESGIYPHMERFERISKYVHFPWASGLPGRAWEYAAPQMLTNIGQSLAFLRSSGAVEAGLDTGISYPCMDSKHLRGVVVFLSNEKLPLFRAIEIWRPVNNRLKRIDAYGEAANFLSAGRNQQLPPGDGLAGRAWAEKNAVIDADLSEGIDQRKQAAVKDGLNASIAVPVVMGDEVRAVLQVSI